MFLSIIIPTLNRFSCLLNTINDLLDQQFKNFEIIVVDQSDAEIHNRIISEFTNDPIIVIHSAVRSASLARNIGIIKAKGEVVLFLDDDIIIDHPDFLDAHVRHYKDPSCVGVSGAILNKDETFRMHRHYFSKNLHFGWLFFPINYNKQVKIFNGWAGNLSVRTQLAKDIGGMDQRFEKGAFREESDFCYRLCKKYGAMIYEPAAYMIHIGAQTGGLRNFSVNNSIRGQHHFDGMFYFLFKNIPVYHYPFHLLSFFKIFYKIETIKKNPGVIWELVKRTFKGVYNGAIMNSKGPLYIQD